MAQHVLGDDAAAIDPILDGPVAAALAAIDARPGPVVVVSDEVGLGIVPMHAGARAYRDLVGIAHQRLAAWPTRSYLLVAGSGPPEGPPMTDRTAGNPTLATQRLARARRDRAARRGGDGRGAAQLDRLTKPPGSLGRLETLAIQLAGITGVPCADRRRAIVVAAGGPWRRRAGRLGLSGRRDAADGRQLRRRRGRDQRAGRGGRRATSSSSTSASPAPIPDVPAGRRRHGRPARPARIRAGTAT